MRGERPAPAGPRTEATDRGHGRICSPPMERPANPEPLNVWEYERLAADLLDEATHGYFAGGANDEWTLSDNVEAFRRWQLRPRVLVDVAGPSTTTSVLGHEL